MKWPNVSPAGHLRRPSASQSNDVLVLAQEDSASVVPNPVREALREGKVASLGPHTLLVSRDGRRIPIDGSAAPIRLADRTAGVVWVFRDISERRRLEADRESQDRLARELAAIVETSDDAIVSKDLQSTSARGIGAPNASSDTARRK